MGVWPDDSTAEYRDVDYFGNATWRLTAEISEWTRRSLRERQHQPNCEIATPADNCLAVKYESNSPWSLTADSLKMTSINGDMRGEFMASVSAPSDSGRLVTGIFKGKFKAPLGDDSFTVEGSIEFCGWLTFDGSEYRIMLNVVKGDGSFVGLAGYKESFWLPNDERVYFGGTLYFPQSKI